ncbi:unnamed protein product [Cylindrotheca closterium]|uniref:protein-tyrosine sulfotransferase n=1 Tax=Cylindrotheca closterium TaxID=2856 RepID=A0AAD2GB20_9STRA|nr:unnamed protein product [Cylindrotheca closterium]
MVDKEDKIVDPQMAPHYYPSVPVAVFVCWVVPVVLIAALSRFAVDTNQASIPLSVQDNPKPTSPIPAPTSTPSKSKRQISTKRGPLTVEKGPSGLPTVLANKPTSYIEIVESIGRKRVDWGDITTDIVGLPEQSYPNLKSSASSKVSQTEESEKSDEEPIDPPRGASTDFVRQQHLRDIAALRESYKANADDLGKAISLAEALRLFDVQYHDGGSVQKEALDTFHKAINLAKARREEMVSQGHETSLLHGSQRDETYGEMLLDYGSRSIDGIMCALYTSLGKTYFMANMFERAVESYGSALEINPSYLDALSSRGSSNIILGNYAAAASDLSAVMHNDSSRRFQDVFTGLARILQAKESAVPDGWGPMIGILMDLIPLLEMELRSATEETKIVLLQSLNRLYHVLFVYHDVKTKQTDLAWESLTKSYEYKMNAIEPFNFDFERQKVETTKQIFHKGFFPEGVGSSSSAPIFIIGFVRSGSTLLERLLDSHPQIAGTGENSVFNGQLDHIRNKIVETSVLDSSNLASMIEKLGDGVVTEMLQRWRMVSNVDEDYSPSKMVDKMLTNYYNVGFIHMLFPNALILHVAREPMDTLLSAFKHEFPPGSLDYTSSFKSLAELYHSYRNLMDHWDKELPGRVTHVRYEDMVNDMPGIARKIIEVTGLEWDESVLNFHKKKHAVNTLSTTQVRKGVYKDSIQSWRRYEKHLKPLMDLVGKRASFEDLQTSVKGYVPPADLIDTEQEL